MLPPYPQELRIADITRLIENQVEESLFLEYKQELPSKSDKDVREFLYDVASFSNSHGGDIVYGVTDKRDQNQQSTGLPDKIVGIETPNLPADRARLESIIRDGIAPSIDVRLDVIETPELSLLVVRIPDSWGAPHMVTRDKVNRFYVRGNSGKELMNIDQIRSAFLRKRELGRRVREWRSERLQLIASGGPPVPLCCEAVLVVHAISADFFADGRPLRSWTFPERAREDVYLPARSSGSYPLYNADGFLLHSYVGRGDRQGNERDGAEAYVQVFRSGAVEYVAAGISFLHANPNGLPTRLLNLPLVERTLINCFANVISCKTTFGLTEPLYFGVSLLSWKAMRVYVHHSSLWYSSENPRIDVERFVMPEVLVERTTEESPYPSTLKPIADTIAQVCGLEASPYCETDGTWLPVDHTGRN